MSHDNKQPQGLKPVNDLKEVLKNWQRIKDEIQDTECGGETWDFLSEQISSETSTAQHTLWSGCEKIVELCHNINNQINMAYPHPIPREGISMVPIKFPNSEELLLMAHTEWKNCEERKHIHDEIPWVHGWINGYLTPKPDFKRRFHEKHVVTLTLKARKEILSELADPMKELLSAIGKIHAESTKLPEDYQENLGASIQVCFDKFTALREKMEKSLLTGECSSV